MQMYMKFLVMMTISTVFLLLIFSHLDWQKERYYLEPTVVKQSWERDRADLATDFTDRFPRADTPLAVDTAVHRAPHDTSSASDRVPQLSTPDGDHQLQQGEYPDWFTKGWSRTATAGQRDVFVGDLPLFPACSSTGDTGNKYQFIEPKNYLPNSKNPCWLEEPKKERGLRCLPYFYVAGVAKCGTTDLYRRLRLHPDVMRGTLKEYHFWDRERFGNVDISENGDVTAMHRKPWTFKEYTERLTGDRDLALLRDDLKYSGNSSKIFGDGSPSYLWDISNWKLLAGNEGCKEPRVVIGQHIRHIYPPSKIIIIFRHPTPRLYSRFLSRIWRTPYLKDATSQTFHDYVVNAVRMYRDCFKRWSIRHCAYNFTLYDQAVVRLVEGMYPVFMADWLRVWPRHQMLLLRNEDYSKNVSATMDTAFDFLGVGHVTGAEREKVEGHVLVNVGAEYDKLGPMKLETARILDRFYQPFVQQLADLLHDPRFLWSDVYTPNLTEPSPAEQDIKREDKRQSLALQAAEPQSQTEKAVPLWARLFLQFKPQSLRSGNQTGGQHQDQRIVRIDKAPGVPIKRARYPAWWEKGWPKSATSGLGDMFLGDQPFFAPCSSSSSYSSSRRHAKVYSMLEPRNYVAGVKNPCWFTDPQHLAGLRCLPYFYVAGVAKSGTSDLWRRLRLHSDVMRGSMKEYHWWDRGRYGDFYSDDLPIKAEKPQGLRIPFKQYTDMISGKQGVAAVMHDLNTSGTSHLVFGDHSPSYFNDVKLWALLQGNQDCNEPRVTIGQHIHHVTPYAKIIIVVRHPTPRLYHRFLARVPEKVSVRKAASFAFHRLVKKSVNMYKSCFDRWSVRHCAYNTTLYLKDKVKLWEGMYSVFLWDWLRVFPRQQIQVIRYRDLIRDTKTTMAQLFRFLDLPPLNETTMRGLTAEKWLERREEHELKKYFGPMVPETVDMLNDFYEPFVDKFAETLNDERFLWRDSDHL